MGRVANRGYEVRRAYILSLTVVRSTAECRRTERIVADAGQRMGRIGRQRIGCRRRAEAAGKPSPGNALFVQQVADILTGHFDRDLAGSGAALVIAAII